MNSLPEADIQIGDVVRLNSGGLDMTVTSIDPPEKAALKPINCAWFQAKDGFGEGKILTSGSFPAAALTKVK